MRPSSKSSTVLLICEAEIPKEKAHQNNYREFIEARQGYVVLEAEMPVCEVKIPNEKAHQNNYREFIEAR